MYWFLSWFVLFFIILISSSLFGLGGAENLDQALDAQTKEVVIHGYVEQINHPIAVVMGDDNQIYNIRLGPYSYWQKKGYQLKVGDEITVVGYRRGKLLFPKVIVTPQGKMYFRDDNGVPLWRSHPQ